MALQSEGCGFLSTARDRYRSAPLCLSRRRSAPEKGYHCRRAHA